MMDSYFTSPPACHATPSLNTSPIASAKVRARSFLYPIPFARVGLLLLFLASHVGVAHSAELIYVPLAGAGFNRVVTYDVSLGDATSVQNSMAIFASTNLNSPHGLAFDSSGNLFVSNLQTAGSITKITPGGVSSIFVNSGLENPQGLAFNPAGDLFVSNTSPTSPRISKITPGGTVSTFATALLNQPRGLAFDSAGDLYASNFGNTISRYTPGGSASVFASGATDLGNPLGIAFDSTGNLIVANTAFSPRRISQFTPGGTGSVFATMTDTPQGVAFDSVGNLYVTSSLSSTISKFNSLGVFQFSWSTGANSSPRYPAFVPEPSTYVLCGLAAGVLALLSRRKSRAAKVIAH